MALLSDLWHLSRPRLAPFVLALVGLGWAWAHWDRALRMRGGEALAQVLLAWWLLHAGTLWLNAALDQDEGEVLLGRAIPPPPGIERWGLLALAAGVLVAAHADPLAGGAAALSALLSVLYSHPRTAWKGHPVGGPFVNAVGYGMLSPLAGWAVVDVAPNPRTLAVWLAMVPGVLGCYFAAQAFQGEEDAARGYRTMVVTHGPSGAITAARIGVGLSGILGMGLAAWGWLPRVCLAAAPLWLWTDAWLALWSRVPDGGRATHAVGFARRLLLTVLVAVYLAFGDYARQSANGQPVAGLGTESGHPTDRPRLPPHLMDRWEAGVLR